MGSWDPVGQWLCVCCSKPEGLGVLLSGRGLPCNHEALALVCLTIDSEQAWIQKPLWRLEHTLGSWHPVSSLSSESLIDFCAYLTQYLSVYFGFREEACDCLIRVLYLMNLVIDTVINIHSTEKPINCWCHYVVFWVWILNVPQMLVCGRLLQLVVLWDIALGGGWA